MRILMNTGVIVETNDESIAEAYLSSGGTVAPTLQPATKFIPTDAVGPEKPVNKKKKKESK